MKFIHTADIHLGMTPDVGYQWSEQRTKEIWDSFKRLIQTVQKESVDLLLIAGDLFHRQPLMRELKEVDYLFSTIPDTKIVLIAGNHDYVKVDSCYQRFSWCENVIGLWGDTLQEVYLPTLNTWVYGFSYHSREINEAKLRNVRANGQPGHHILLAHGGDEKHLPIAKRDVLQADFDYVALGHIHIPGQVIPNKAAYAGALEPLDRNDTGQHGYILGSCEDGRVQTKFVSSAIRSYVNLELAVNQSTTQYEVQEQLEKRMQQWGSENIYKVTLSGSRQAETLFRLDYLAELGNVIEIRDLTQPDYDLDKLQEEYAGSLISKYISHFRNSEDPIEKKALYYGLRALLEVKG